MFHLLNFCSKCSLEFFDSDLVHLSEDSNICRKCICEEILIKQSSLEISDEEIINEAGYY